MGWQPILNGAISAFLGSGLTFAWFYQFGRDYFFKRLAKKYDEEIETLKAQLERSTFVTKAHFDTEFAAYKEIFGALADTRRAIEATRPFFSLVLKDEKREERDQATGQRLKALVDAHQKAAVTVENSRPFYEPFIYEKILECLKAVNLEVFQIATADDSKYSVEWYKQANENQANFLTAYGKVADMIRHRINGLAVLPGS